MADAPPADLDAEESLLGAMLLSPRAVDAAVGEVSGLDFYRGSHRLVFDAAVELYAAGVAVDPLTVADALDRAGRLDQAGGRGRVNELAALVPAASSARHYARIVREASLRRGLAAAGAEIARLAVDRGAPAERLIEQAERALFDVAAARSRSDLEPLAPDVAAAYRQITEAHEHGADVTGLPTGFERLDELTSGLQPRNLILLAGRPSLGKSALAFGIAAHVSIRAGLPVALFTLEMSRQEVVQRLIGIESLVEARRIRAGRLTLEDWPRLTDACSRIQDAPLYVDDSPALTAVELRSKARRLKMRLPDLALVIVDYLQLMASGPIEHMVQEVSQISRSLKVLAGELDVARRARSQLSRAPAPPHDKRPILSDLRQSGGLEQDADVVLMLYRDEYYNPEEIDQAGIAEVNVAKHRNGPTGTIKLSFVRKLARFGDLAPDIEERQP